MNRAASRARSTPRDNGTSADHSIYICDLDLRIPCSALTLSGYRAWAHAEHFPTHGSISYLNGELYIDMSPEEISTHNKAKNGILYELERLDRRQPRGELFSDGVLFTNEKANLSTEPDGMFILYETLQTGSVQRIARTGTQGEFIEIQGTPDLVFEVVSKNSARKDYVELKQAYHRAGIPEYWLIDARKEQLEFVIFRWALTEYEPVKPSRGWAASRVYQRRFRLRREARPLNCWVYHLDSRPGG